MNTFYLVVQSGISGILVGFIYALIAVGLTLIFGVMHIANFAHGVLLMLGMYCAYWLFTLVGLDPYIAAFVSAAVLFVIGLAIQRVLISRVMHAHHYIQIILTFGVLILFENVALVLWSPDFRSITPSYSLSVIEIGQFCVSIPRLIASGFALALTGCLYWFIKKTDLGLAIQATAQDEAGARLAGIDIGRIHMVVFGIGSACAGFAGALLTPFFYTAPDVGNVFLMTAFVVVVLGGMGSFEGALLGGVIIGLVESLGAALIGASLKGLVIYVIFMAVLLLKPTGLFGGKRT